MKSWEVWTFEGHPVIIVSNQARIDRKTKVVVLKGQSIYSGDPHATVMEAVLDVEDGLDRRTVFVCDLLFTALKSELTQNVAKWSGSGALIFREK